jgi:hypothetical protein
LELVSLIATIPLSLNQIGEFTIDDGMPFPHLLKPLFDHLPHSHTDPGRLSVSSTRSARLKNPVPSSGRSYHPK